MVVEAGVNQIREHGKLEELRAKTDRQLLTLVNHRIESALRCPPANASSVRAAYTEVRNLLPVIFDVSPAERSRLHARLEQLRQRLGTGNPVSAAAHFCAC